jgi:hypothetical protein
MSVFSAIRNYINKIKQEAEEAHCPAAVSETGFASFYSDSAWIGVDLDGTLAWYDQGSSIAEIGPPIAPMMEMVNDLIARGRRVKIFTARASDPEQLVLIQQWLRRHGLPPLEITNAKDFNMVRLYDDRCVQVETNTGRIISERTAQQKDMSEK